jgi:hypothetical protein
VPFSGSNYAIGYVGSSVRLLTNFWLSVQFDGKAKVEVKVPRTVYKGVLTGACGANTGNCADDYRKRDKTYIGSVPFAGTAIGDSYVVSDPDVSDQRSVAYGAT